MAPTARHRSSVRAHLQKGRRAPPIRHVDPAANDPVRPRSRDPDQPGRWAGVADQPWTLLTVCVTGEALLHLVVAVLVIGLVGSRFERLVGAAHVVAVYLLAGLAGSCAFVATAAATGYDEPSVGASVAFLGLVGALAASPRGACEDRQHHPRIVLSCLLARNVRATRGLCAEAG
jgi:membrane associated rhomboid family serine protease